jgi:hypothetical protein
MESYYLCFPSVGNWLIWKIGKGDKLQISLDPWVGSKGKHILPLQMIQELRNKGYFNLFDRLQIGQGPLLGTNNG